MTRPNQRPSQPRAPSSALDVFPNPAPQRDYRIRIECPEFTCLCPLTNQPDFATLVIDYIPDRQNIELKALKLYFWSFRDRGVFHEAVTNEIVDTLAARLKPRFLRLTAKWYVRGGIYTHVVAEHRKRGWKPQERVDFGNDEGIAATGVRA